MMQVNDASSEFIEERHGFGFGFVSDVDVWFHALIVGMAGPLHDDLGRDTKHQGVADECASPGVCAN